MSASLKITGISHSYGSVEALSDVSLTVEAGTFTVLLGVNGAGKTTLFNLITRLFATQSGRIEIHGTDLNLAPSQALAAMGVVFQSRALDASLTVAQNMIYQGALQGIGRRETLARADVLLDRVGLSGRMGDKAARLSGGQQRRVEIARALIHRPRLILCDEATVGLDVKSRTEIVADLHRMAAEDGLGVLWTTHLIDEVSETDPVYVLHRGEILVSGPAVEIAKGRTLSEAFLALTGKEPEGPTLVWLAYMRGRHSLAGSLAVPAAEGALLRRSCPPSGLALHIRRRLPRGSGPLDHRALSDIHSLRDLRGSRPLRHDTAIQWYAVEPVHGL